MSAGARIRDFRLLWASEAISLIGDQFHFVALSWLVIVADPARASRVGTVLIASGVPRAMMLVPFGVVADRRPPRTLMLVAQSSRGLTVGAIAALVRHGRGVDPAAGAARRGVRCRGRAVHAGAAGVPAAHPRRRPPAVGERAAPGHATSSTSIVAPPIAGVVIAVTSTGVAFAVDAVSFVLAAIVVAMISSRDRAHRHGRGCRVATRRSARRAVPGRDRRRDRVRPARPRPAAHDGASPWCSTSRSTGP